MIPEDPFENGGIVAFARRFRAGEVTSAAVTRAFLDRIQAVDHRVQAYWHVDYEGAMAAAEAMDAARAAGVDVGPLMGVPVAIKDLIAVNGMPVTYGTRMAVPQSSEKEGTYVQRLRRCGCVLLGKTATVELAFGTTGINRPMGTPRNPHDLDNARICGGSSSGSGAAVAAGLAGFAVGTDTGGSVRIPAALCGVFGHKTTKGLIATDGVFPLSPTFDTIGPLSRSAADAALIHQATTGETVPEVALDAVRLRKPTSYFFEDLSEDVAEAVNRAVESLRGAGVSISDIDLIEASEREWIYPAIVPGELMSAIGAERFATNRQDMDSLTAHRAEAGLSASAVDYIDATKRMKELHRTIARRMAVGEAILTPTVPIVAPKIDDLDDLELGLQTHNQLARNVQPVGIFGQCGVSIPLDRTSPGQPVGLQLASNGGSDGYLLGMAVAMERLLGVPRLAHLHA